MFYVEEPVFGGTHARMAERYVKPDLTVCTPHLPACAQGRVEQKLAALVAHFFRTGGGHWVLWFCTPMALPWAAGLPHELIVYDPPRKICPSALPRAPNIHYLRAKHYADLPLYLRGWQVALMPYALNAATRFISPTKTLEYMAGCKPIVSTAVRDVVKLYGEPGLVQIADCDTFATAIDRAMAAPRLEHLVASKRVLRRSSWDSICRQMCELMDRHTRRNAGAPRRAS